MVSFRTAYSRFIRAAKKKNIEDGIVDKSVMSSIELEVHHIVPKSLGGSNKFKNLVMLSHEDHIYAHLLLNFALMQEKRDDDLKKLSYTIPTYDKLRQMFKTKHPFRGLKVDVRVNANGMPPVAMSLDEAAKYFCFTAHLSPRSETMVNSMFATVIRTAMSNGSKFGYKMMFHI